ncbi:unnamed protein product [Fusarium graminearum]|nr:unnamed protein product [Fusarium graminearum]CAG1961000.1 unnamed protein product [Fusarium graminearum]VTO83890.1 unnamed protein product [Fusarium graminearum]
MVRDPNWGVETVFTQSSGLATNEKVGLRNQSFGAYDLWLPSLLVTCTKIEGTGNEYQKKRKDRRSIRRRVEAGVGESADQGAAG